MIDSYTLFPANSQWPKPALVECTICGCLVANDMSTSIDRHVRWHKFIELVGVTNSLHFSP
jgi:hypothetical protein